MILRDVYSYVSADGHSYYVRTDCIGILIIIFTTFGSFWYLQEAYFSTYNSIYKREIRDFQYKKYLINTPACKIPDEDPFREDVKPYFYKESYVQCSKLPLLTYVEYKDNSAILSINNSLKSAYSIFSIECCYSTISRVVEENQSDDEVEFSTCRKFVNSTRFDAKYIHVTCSNFFGITVYSNVHAAILDKSGKQGSQNREKFNIMFMGIDSISKGNLARTMPKTREFLEDNFINLKGYTKVADNTFPNLMAILSGFSLEQAYNMCHPSKQRLDNCDIIWKKFKDNGYTTAYAEDYTSISTFNFGFLGFKKEPTDFYLRPYFLAAERLPSYYKHFMSYCTGPETSAERIMKVAKDFTVNLSKHPKFSFWWMNTFSHNNINTPSSMDITIERYLRSLQKHLNDTIFIFFSDHGFRFGDIRFTHTGWLEERLPFIYIYIPEKFKARYRDQYNNLLINSERLTNPFDLHMTLQDILKYSNESFVIKPSKACPRCQSLFNEIDPLRSCEDAAIKKHWCLCKGHSYIDPHTEIVTKVGNFVVGKINELINTFPEGSLCSTYFLRRIKSAGISEEYVNEKNLTVNYFLLQFETIPPARFEATVESSKDQNDFYLLGEISRLSRYKENSLCVKDPIVKKYCYCDGLLNSIKNSFCELVNCW